MFSLRLFGQDYYMIQESIGDYKMREILEDQNINYEIKDYGHMVEMKSWLTAITFTDKDNIKFITLLPLEVRLSCDKLDEWNKEHPGMVAYNSLKHNPRRVTIASNVKLYGGVTSAHIVKRLRAFVAEVDDFHEKYKE
jgi:hypothetical protein